jgi:hypothetical protein
LNQVVAANAGPIINGMPGEGCTLWAPNHTLVPVVVVSATAASGLESLVVEDTLNEPINGLGDGNTLGDIVIIRNPDGSYAVALRAERSGTLRDRIYTLTATASDLAGNTTTSTATCTVPHNK